MALQGKDLILLRLGVQNDQPPNTSQPKLDTGIHLRWAPSAKAGFPWYGFYLLRAPSPTQGLPINEDLFPVLYSRGVRTTYPFGTEYNLSGVCTLRSDVALKPIPETSSSTTIGGFDLAGRQYLRIDFETPAVQAAFRITFSGTASINVKLYHDTVLIAEKTVVDQNHHTFNLDNITSIVIAGGKGVLDDVIYGLAQRRASVMANNWQLVPGTPNPLALPIWHPDYPAARRSEEIWDFARLTAVNRVRYNRAKYDAMPSRLVTRVGTVTVVNGSPIVIGSGTAWGNELEGMSFYVAARREIYTIARVLAPNRLVLRRPYSAPSQSLAGYEIIEDWFADLYDNLALLVRGGVGYGAMSSRSYPQALSSFGTVTVRKGQNNVTGASTSWTADLVLGCGIQFSRKLPGTIKATPGAAHLFGSGTSWSKELEGMIIRIDGPSYYIIKEVHSATHITLNRPYLEAAKSAATYTITDDTVYTVAAVGAATQLTLDRPYAGPDLTGTPYQLVAPLSIRDEDGSVSLPRQYPYDLLSLSSLDPAYAQMLGLYWVDTTVTDPTLKYDYLLIADYTGVINGDIARARSLISQSRFSEVEAYIICNCSIKQQAALSAPSGLQGTALPPSNLEAGGYSANIGLTWDLGRSASGVLMVDRPLFYHLWRWSAPGNPTTPTLPDKNSSSYQLITKDSPILVSEPKLGPNPELENPKSWPWMSGPASTIDSGLPNGFWYSYVVNGVDIFGRHTLKSNPSPALLMRDMTPPPMPLAVEAQLLDPDDPLLNPANSAVQSDALFYGWRTRAGNERLYGLRVRWRWGEEQQLQAPDLKEFRIYYHPDASLPDQQMIRYKSYRIYIHPAGQFTADGANRKYDIIISLTSADAPPSAPNCMVPPWSPTVSYTAGQLASYNGHEWQATQAIVGGPAPGPNTAWSDWGVCRLSLNDNSYLRRPTLSQPLVYSFVGVSAADGDPIPNDPHTLGPLRAQPGNEGPIGGPARVVLVRRTPPARPALPPAPSGNVYATPADYYGRSFYPYAWTPPSGEAATAPLFVHVFRALDDSLFKLDWGQRPRPELDPASTSEPSPFPDEWRASAELSRRQQIAAALKALNDLKRAGGTLQQALAAYAALNNDALRVLAALPGNERAFSQITIEPLPAARGSHKDTLDGKALNRYFYRSAMVDGAQNRSPLGPSSPPIYLPDVLPPRPPTLIKALAGPSAKAITLVWAANREPDLKEYRVYRSADPNASQWEAAPVRVVAVTAGNPIPASGQVQWTNTGVPATSPVYYRVVAVDTAGNVSLVSNSIMAQSFDYAPPAPLVWRRAQRQADGSILLEWQARAELPRVLVERAGPDGRWLALSGWLADGAASYSDRSAEAGARYRYRTRAQNALGIMSVAFAEIEVLP